MITFPRYTVALGVGVLALLTLLLGYSSTAASSRASTILASFSSEPPAEVREAGFHLLLPATAANINVCQLMVSGSVAGWPEPIFIGWKGHGRWDGTKSHLFKISETLVYLQNLPPSSDDDLVLILDAYDIFLQLRAETMIARYYRMLEYANRRLAEQGLLGRELNGSPIRQTVLFGPDKQCWPGESRRAACWAIPSSTFHPKVFGPDTDTWMVPNRPKWLNSGTIMGPVKDVRDVFEATLNRLDAVYDEKWFYRNSDQFYFQEVWVDQEIARARLTGQKFDNIDPKKQDLPKPPPAGQRVEYHMVLDHESIVFQTSAAYSEYCTWMRYNESLPLPPGTPPLLSPSPDRLDLFQLDDAVLDAPGPYSAVDDADNDIADLPTKRRWADVMLGTNTVTSLVFPLFHLTGVKALREAWWPRMWFHPHALGLMRASRKQQVKSLLETAERGDEEPRNFFAEWNGVRYYGGHMAGKDAKKQAEARDQTLPGAWSDLGEYLKWNDLCGAHEKALFLEKQIL